MKKKWSQKLLRPTSKTSENTLKIVYPLRSFRANSRAFGIPERNGSVYLGCRKEGVRYANAASGFTRLHGRRRWKAEGKEVLFLALFCCCCRFCFLQFCCCCCYCFLSFPLFSFLFFFSFVVFTSFVRLSLFLSLHFSFLILFHFPSIHITPFILLIPFALLFAFPYQSVLLPFASFKFFFSFFFFSSSPSSSLSHILLCLFT